MNTFELSDNAVVLNRRNASRLCEAISRVLTHKPFCFTSNIGTSHVNCCLIVLRDQHTIEIIGIDDVVYRIPYRAHVEVDGMSVRVELRSIVHSRRDPEATCWQLVVQERNDFVGIPIGYGKPPLLPSPSRMAWPKREDDCLQLASLMKMEMAVSDG